MGVFTFQIVGAGRGGTSLVGGLVDAHPQCEVQFETFALRSLMGRDDPPVRQNLRDRTVRRIARYAGACAAAAAGSAKPVWGHKTTAEQIFELVEPALPNPEGFDAVGDFIETFRQLMTVFIVRDGRTCIPSKMRRAGLSLELAIARWQFSIGLLRRLNEAGVRLHVLRMEDLLMDGPGELKQVCAALDVAYDPIMLTGTQNEKMLPAYRRDKLDPNAAAIPAEQEWVAQIAPELRYLGYRV